MLTYEMRTDTNKQEHTQQSSSMMQQNTDVLYAGADVIKGNRRKQAC